MTKRNQNVIPILLINLTNKEFENILEKALNSVCARYFE